MMVRWGRILTAALVFVTPAAAGELEISSDIGLEVRTFFEDPVFPEQFETFQPSLILNTEIFYESEDRRHQFVVQPFVRLDSQDDERTHVDLREAYYRYAGDEFDLLLGVSKVFWGVTESRHLVDIINQTDGVEDIDEEDKLGQPMVKLSLLKDWGQLDLFMLPYFRERNFPGVEGRLRTPLIVDTDTAIYEDDDEENHVDVAARYSNFFGSWDVGVSVFHGTSREPRFVPGGTIADPRFIPAYDQITQAGLDIQYTKDAWLWKFEGIVREGQGDTFTAAVAGLEYTFFGVSESGADLGVLVEYLYDDRDEIEAPITPQDNDLFYGARYALNDIQDTSILAGAISDVEDGSTSGLVEAERRLGENWKGELEARFFLNVDDQNLLNFFEQDSHLTLRLTRYF